MYQSNDNELGIKKIEIEIASNLLASIITTITDNTVITAITAVAVHTTQDQETTTNITIRKMTVASIAVVILAGIKSPRATEKQRKIIRQRKTTQVTPRTQHGNNVKKSASKAWQENLSRRRINPENCH